MAVSKDFTASELDLNGAVSIGSPTALVWGPDGRLYVTEVDGDVKVLTVAFGDPNPGDGDPTAQFYVTDAQTLSDVKSIPNFDDDGTSNGSAKRQVTGIDVTAQYDGNGDPVVIDGRPAVVIYVTSSDSRIGAGGGGGDANLDTNSGVITRLTQTQTGWDAVDIVRGLARSEENHATNGLEVIQEIVNGQLVSERLIVANGGNANTGAPSNNFAGQQEQPLSAAILEIDLDEIRAIEVADGPKTDNGRTYVYDLPTLNDPTRAGETDGNDPFGGNDGLNSAKLIAGGPVQIYSAGYRNAYDVEVTEDGRVWTYDNGANNNWGGRPAGEDSDGDTNSTEAAELGAPPAGYISTNLFVEDNAEIAGNYDPQNWDQLHEVTRSDDLNGRSLSAGQGGALTYQWDHPDFDQPLTLVYGGHANPTRAEGARAGILYSPDAGVTGAKLMVSNVAKDDGAGGTTSDFLEVVDWFQTIGYTTSFIADTVVALDPGVRYADQFVAGYTLPTQAGVFSLVEDADGPVGLPADIDEIVHQVNPIEGDFREAAYTDGAVDSGKGSINGLAEYTSSIFDDAGQTGMQGALFAASLNQTQYYIIGRNDDGIVGTTTGGAGNTIAADRAFFQSGGAPLGLASIGDDVSPYGNNGAFRGSVWGAIYKQNGPVIEILQPGNPDSNPLLGVNFYAGQEPSDPTDNDLDGVDHIHDPFEFDADNGLALAAGQTLELNFSQVDLAATPEFSGTIGDTGLLGAALDNATPNRDAITEADGAPVSEQRSGLFDNAGNVIPGGNAPILQIKAVQDGTAVGGANTLRDGLHTGVKIADDVQRITAEVDIANWYNDQPGGGRITGLSFGDGTQSNFVRLVWGDIGGSLGLELGIETNDGYTPLATAIDPDFTTALTSGDATTLRNKQVTLQLEISGIGETYAIGARWKTSDDAGFSDIASFTDGPFDAALPAGVLRDVLDGRHTISDGDTTLPSGAAIGIVAEKDDGVPFTAVDFPEIRIEGFGSEIDAPDASGVSGAQGTAGTDTILYSGTDTQLGTLPGDIENFDGSKSAAGFTVSGNALDNTIKVGAGADTVATGGGADKIVGTGAALDGDTITDFEGEDKVVITDATIADASSVSYGAGSARVTVNGTTITFDSEAFDGFAPEDGPSTFQFSQGADGLEISLVPDETVVYRVNAAGNVTGAGAGTIAAVDDGPDWLSDVALAGSGITLSGPNNTFTDGQTSAEDDVDFDNVDPAEVPWQVFVNERGDNTNDANQLGYDFQVTEGKTFRIELFYTENWNGIFQGGPRAFDVSVEGSVPAAFDDLNPLAEAAAFVGSPAPTTNNGPAATEDLYLGVARRAEFTYTAQDDVLNLLFVHQQQNPKINAIQITQLGGIVQPPADTAAPVVSSINVLDDLTDQDSPRSAIVTLADETGLDLADIQNLDGSELSFSGFTTDPTVDGAPQISLSGDGKTATLTYSLLPPSDTSAWPTGDFSVAFAAAEFQDAAGNENSAASFDFTFAAPAQPGQVVLAVNAGGGAVDGAAYGLPGVTFEADTSAAPHPTVDFSKSTSNNSGNSTNSNGATDTFTGADLPDTVFQTERWADEFSYDVDLPNGTYLVDIYLAEIYLGTNVAGGVGDRVFDLAIEGQTVLDDYDLVDDGDGILGNSAGAPNVKIVKTFEATVGDGQLNILLDAKGADAVDNAKISAFVVRVPGGGDTAVSVSGPGTVVEAGDGDPQDLTFVLTAADGLTGDLDVTLSIDGASGVLQTLSFASGEATVTVPVATDTVWNDSDSVSLELLSVETGGYSPASGAALATATVTEDETPDSYDLDGDGPGAPVEVGDFSDLPAAPTDLGTLSEGSTTIVASQQGDSAPGGRERDYFTFTVAAGQELTGIVLDDWQTGGSGTPQAFIGLADGSQVTVDPATFDGAETLKGGYVYNSGDVANAATSQDGNLIDELGDGEEQGYTFGDGSGFTAPLTAGTYTIWLNQGGAASTATLRLVTAPAADAPLTLSIAAAAPVLEADGATLDFTLTTSDAAFSGDVEVTYDTADATGETQTVTFAGGTATLAIPVVNDTVADGDDTISITLTGATDLAASDPQTIQISTDAGSASGTVTEDDTVAITYERGAVVSAFNAGGPDYTVDGITFAAATSATDGAPFASGQVYTDGQFGQPDQPVFDGTVYETEINSGGDGDGLFTFSSALNVDPAKKYFVDLYFAELYESEAETRTFSVTAEGNPLPELTDYNVVAASGDVDSPIIVQLNDPIEPGANGAIDLSFITDTNRAKVNAIVIREAVEVDPTAVIVSVADVTVAEEGGVALIEFTREGNTDTEMTITFSTADGSATAGDDYTAATAQTVTILANETSATASITLTDDSDAEEDETFTVTIDDAVAAGANVTIAAATATITVTDSDAPLVGRGEFVFGVNAGGRTTPVTDESGNLFEVPVASEWVFNQASGSPGGNDVDYTGDGVDNEDDTVYETEYWGGSGTGELSFTRSGIPAGDYILVVKLAEIFANADQPGERVFDVTVNGQLAIDDLDLVAEVGQNAAYDVDIPVTIADEGDGTGTLTVEGIPSVDNAKVSALALYEAVAVDPTAVTVSVADVTVSEVDGTALLTFERSGNLAEAVEITFAVTPGTAVEGGDYTVPAVTAVTIPANATSATLTITLTDDAIEEAEEAFTVEITNATSAGATGVTGIGATGTVTIADDDLTVGTAPNEDLDGDGIANSADPDVDGDTVLNGDETFSYDATNAGTALASGQSVRFDFDTDGTPFQNGLTGALLSPNKLDPEVNLGNAAVSGGALTVTATKGDHFNTTNTQQNALVAAFSAAEGLKVETRFAAPDFDPATDGQQSPLDFQAAGLVFGTNQNDLVKIVFGRSANEFQLSNDSGTDAKTKGVPAADYGTVKDLQLVLELVINDNGVDPATVTAKATGTLYGSDDLPLAGFDAFDLGEIAVSPALATLVLNGEPIGAGVIQTSTGNNGRAGFDVSYQYLEVTAQGGLQNLAPSVEVTPVVTEIAENAVLDAPLKVADIVLTDDGVGDNVLGLDGDDAGLFEIVTTNGASELFLEAGTSLDFETAAQLDVTVTVDDTAMDGTPGASAGFSLAVTDVNEAPTVTVTPVVTSLPEDADTAAAIVIATVVVDDDALGTNDLTLAGAHAEAFEIVGTELVLKAGTALDFESTPSFDLSVVIDDAAIGDAAEATVPVVLEVTNVDERIQTTGTPGDLPTEGGGTDEIDVVEYTGTAAVGAAEAPYVLPDGFENFDASGATGTVNVKGNDGDNIITVGTGADDTVDLTSGGADTVVGTAEALDGTVITGLGADDEIVVTGGAGASVVSVLPGSTVIGIDTDGIANTVESTITLAEDVDTSRILTETVGGDLVITIAADSPPEVAEPIGARVFDEDAPLDFAVPAGTFSDDGGEGALTLTATLADGTDLPDWLTFDTETRSFTGTPDQAEVDAGPIEITVTATDAQGGAVSDAFILTVAPVNDAPVAGDDAGEAFTGFSASFTAAQLLANDTDQDGGTLSVTAVGGASTGTVELVDGVAVFTPAAGFSGTATFDYTVADPSGAQDTGTVSVEVIDGAPVDARDIVISQAALSSYSVQDAQPDSATVSADGSSIAITGNSWKSLALGESLTAAEGMTLRFTFASDDLGEINAIGLESDNSLGAGGPQVFFGVAGTQVQDGSFKRLTDKAAPLYEAGDGPVTYEIDLGAYAGQSFDRLVFVNDADQQSGEGTFSNVQILTPLALNAAPVAADDAFTVQGGSVLSLTPEALLDNDSDVDGDALTIVSVGAAEGGTVALDSETGIVTFTPDEGTVGAASFEYTVSDGNGGTDTASVAVTVGGSDVVTDVAIATSALSSYDNQDRQRTAFEVRDGGETLALTGNTWKKLDLPGDGYAITANTKLRFTFDSADLGEINAIGLEADNSLSTQPQLFFGIAGTEVASGAFKRMTDTVGELYQVGDGPVTYEIDLGAYAGQSYGNLVFVNDADNQSGSSSFTNVQFVESGIGGANAAPVAGDDAFSVEENGTLVLAPAKLLANDIDADGDMVSVAAVSNAVGGTVAIDAVGRIVFTPAAGTTGPASFEYTVTDGNGGTDAGSVAVTVTSEGAGETVTEIDFGLLAISSYGRQDARPGAGFEVEAGGGALSLDGNVWKSVDLGSFEVTEDTVLRFDFRLDQLGEIHGIGLEDDNDLGNGGAFFQLAGTQTLKVGDQTHRGEYGAAGDTVSYTIDLSDYAGRTFDRMVFVNDHDGAPRNAAETFSNVRLVKGVPDDGIGEGPFIEGGEIADLTLTEDAAFEFNLPILDPDSGFDLSFKGLPDFVTATSTTLSGTPEGTDVGSYTVTVTATDPDLNTVSDTFQITVGNVNDMPVAAAATLPSASAVLGSGVALALPPQFFTDEDPGDALTYSLVGPSAGLTIDATTGEITGAPDVAGAIDLTVRATDLAGAFVDAVLTLDVMDGPPREAILIEAEDFTGLGAPGSNFVLEVTGNASGDRLVRLAPNSTGEIETALDAAGTAPGFYDLTITYFDEIDGVAELTVLLDNGDGPQEIGAKSFDATGLPGQGSSVQAGNIQSFTIPGVDIGPGARLILRGVSDGDLVRIDKVALDPVDNAAPVLAAEAAVTVAENASEVATIAATDPEGQDISYAVTGGVDADLFAVDADTGALSFAAAPDFEAPGDKGGDNVYEVEVSASDGTLSGVQAVSVTVEDANEAPVGAAPGAQRITQGESVSLPTLASLFADPDAGDTVTYAVDQLPAGVTVGADSVTLEGTPTTPGTTTVTVTATDAGGLTSSVSFDVIVAEEGAVDPAAYAPDGDLDGDGILNGIDDDVDGDLVDNVDDPFAYDDEDGMTLAAGETKTYGFDLDGTIFENGMTGFLQGKALGFDEDTGAARVSGGAMVVDPVTSGDTGGPDDPQDDAVVGVKNGTFTATASVVNPWAAAAPNPNSFDQLGLVLGLDSVDMIKLVFGQSGGVVEFQVQEDNAATKFGGGSAGANIPFPAGVTFDNFATAEITFDVTSSSASAATVAGTIRFLDAGGVEIGALGPIDAPIGGALAAALADADAGVAVGFTHVNGGGAPSFVAELDSLEITAPDDGTGGGTGGGTGEDEAVFRINAGGPTVAASDGGPVWLGDSAAAPSTYLAVTDNRTDTGGTATSTFEGVPDAIFAEARSSDLAFSYDIPVDLLGGGENYEVRLYFAEIFSGGQTGGFRNFDATLEGFTTAAFDNIDPGALFGAGTGVITSQIRVTDGVLNIGFEQDIEENPIINGIEIVALSGEVDGPPPPVDPGDALAVLSGLTDVDDDGSYGGGATGSATLTVMKGNNGVDKSNFGSGSFQLANTGDKQIAAVFMDFRSALYGDSVVDFDGTGGDTAAKKFGIDGTNTVGGFFDNDVADTYFFPGEAPDEAPSVTGQGVISPVSGGWRGLLVKFDGTEGGFGNGKSVGFSGDMDPNSVAGLPKGGDFNILSGAIDGWDVGGVSGAEIIGSSFTVLFDDETTATGYLGSDDSQAGSVGEAVEGRAAQTATVTVNGFGSAVQGVYGGTVPEIVVTGAQGDVVKVTLTKGFDAVTNPTIDSLVESRLLDAQPAFPANNAGDFQTVNVTIGADGTVTVPAGAFDYDTPDSGADIPGYETLPIAVAVSVVDGDDNPLGPVDRVYLASNGTPVAGGGSGGTGADGYYGIVGNSRFKVQIEDENANGGQDPGGKWSFVGAPDGDGDQAGFQGEGYYLFGSETSTAINGVNASEVLEYTLFIPDEAAGTFNFRLRASRDGDAAGDQQNDIWLNFKKEGTSESIEDYLIHGSNEPEPTSSGFIKVFGGPNNGTWGYASNWDGASGNPSTQLAVTEGGLYTVQIAGRSQGFHVDSFDLYKGGAPSTAAGDSTFILGEPGDGGGGGGGTPGTLVIPIDASADDWEERGGAGSADFEIGENGGPQWSALRFDGIDIPGGAGIERAFIRFEADGNQTGPARFTIAVEDGDDVAPYSAANLPSSRSYAPDAFVWGGDGEDDVEPWTDGGTYDTPDIADLVRAAIGGDGVQDGALGFFFEGTGKRAAVSFDGDGAAPVLHIEFTDEVI